MPKTNLPLNFGGKNSLKSLVGKSISAIQIPEGHSLSEAWLVWILFESGQSIEFSSACTMVNGWHEYGSINCRFLRSGDRGIPVVQEELTVRTIEDSVDKLVFENDEVRTECGVILRFGNASELIVACGVSPGSVSVLLPQAGNKFAPEFPLESCAVEPI